MPRVKNYQNTKVYELEKALVDQGDIPILKALIGDPNLEEIMRNGNGEPVAVVHRKHGPCQVHATLSEEGCVHFAQQIARHNERLLDDDHPIFDGVLPDGSRINIVTPPAALRGISFTIRKFFETPLTVGDLVLQGMSENLAAYLWTAIEGFGQKPANLLVVGGTGSGKTATVGALSYMIPTTSRCVLIEDTPEVRLPQPNTVGLVTTGKSSMVELMRSALRMRPDRIIVGEVRGEEAKVLFEAMNTGHDGCMGTLHANSARESIHRISSAPMNIPLAQFVGLHLILVQRKLPDGRRVMVEVSEVAGFGEGVVRLNQIYAFDTKRNGTVATGIPSRLMSDIARASGLSASQLKKTLKHRGQTIAALARQKLSGERMLETLSKEAMS